MTTELATIQAQCSLPGVYYDIPAEVYHGAAGLSHSMQKP